MHSLGSHVTWKCLILAESKSSQQECNLQGVAVGYSKKVDDLGTTTPMLLRNEKRTKKERKGNENKGREMKKDKKRKYTGSFFLYLTFYSSLYNRSLYNFFDLVFSNIWSCIFPFPPNHKLTFFSKSRNNARGYQLVTSKYMSQKMISGVISQSMLITIIQAVESKKGI
jgi:hypothetical protein